jgi:class 3 adenylate cyclase
MLDVARWLAEHGLGHHAEAFAENGIGSDVLRDLTDADLKRLGLNLGDRKRLLKAIAALAAGPTDARAGSAQPTVGAAAPREAERRQLTVMFVDLVASTELAAQLDPEAMGHVIRVYHGARTDAIERWPKAQEDEAERAIKAGLELAHGVAKLDTPAGAPLAARVGIATGWSWSAS